MNKDIASLLKLNTCTVLPGIAAATKDGNSEFVSLPPLKVSTVFDNSPNLELSANFVHILGNNNEPVHYHISHVVGVILKGSAYLKTDEGVVPVAKGDVVVVPQGVHHEFICDEDKEMDYMAYEVADTTLDFLKHF